MYVYNIELCLKCMKFWGLDPVGQSRSLASALYFISCATISTMCILPLWNLMWLPKIEVVDIIVAVSNLISSADGLIRWVNFKLQRNNLSRIFFLVRHLFWELEDEIGDGGKFKHDRITKLMNNSRNAYSILLFLIWSFYWFHGFISARNFSVKYTPVPPYLQEYIPWYLMFFVMTVSHAFVLWMLVLSDTLLMTFLLSMQLQFNLLNYKMERMFECSPYLARARIRECAQHLDILMTFRQLVHQIYSKSLLLYLAIVVLLICMQMFIGSSCARSNSKYGAFAFALSYSCQFVFLYCHPAQQMLNEADNMPTSLYFGNWNNHPKFHKDVLLLLGKSQQKFFVSAADFIILNYATGVAAFKTMFSYYTFLQTISGPA